MKHDGFMERERPITTTIRLSPQLWSVLRRLAELRTLEGGGRASINAVVSGLVEREGQRVKVSGNA